MSTYNLKNVWDDALLAIELSVSPATFSTWFKGSHIVKIEDNTVYIGVPSQFYKEMLAERYHKIILRSLRDTVEGIRSIEYVISREEKNTKKQQVYTSITNQELPLADHYINRTDNLNPRYTFENFVVGPFNELAHAAGKAVVENPGTTYNPLFIYGNTGYGKTHLLQAIANQLKQKGGYQKMFYTTTERYGGDIVEALQHNTIQKVKNKYRSFDLLILDDIQFLSGKDKLQEELFHIFNTLFEDNKQIIFSSDKHPNHIPDIAERLKTRFAQGMTIDVTEPDHESRVAILKTKALHLNFSLDDAIANMIADEIKGSIRDLEGVLNRIICETKLGGIKTHLSDIKEMIKTTNRTEKKITIDDVVSHVAKYYNIDKKTIFEKTRKKEVVRPRQIIMYIMREHFHESYPFIGNELGGRDHTTVIHSCEKIKEELKNSTELQKNIEEIKSFF
jgi:chromosomal replication initiator protein